MKINLYNMKGLADWIGGADPPTMDEINILVTAGTIYKMAYQNQKFFEAMERIEKGIAIFEDDGTVSRCIDRNSVDILNNALIDKEE